MDARRRLLVTSSGAGVALLGAVSWALAATSMGAVQAAEARALGPGHTADMPGEDELALVAHDARLAGLLVVAAGLALVVAALPRRRALPAWLGGVAGGVVANATLGRAVDGGPLLAATAGLLVVTVAAVAVGLALAARRDPARTPDTATSPGPGTSWPLVTAAALAAGTLPVLQVLGTTSERYAGWVPPALVTSTLVAVLALVAAAVAAAVLASRSVLGAVVGVVLPVAAAAALLERTGTSWQLRDDLWSWGPALVLASAPLVLGTAAGRARPRRAVAVALGALVAVGALLALVPHLLVPPVLLGGGLGLLVTGPAGAYVNYDGLPVVGGGVLLAALLAVVHLAVRGGLGPSPARSAPGRSRATV